MFPFTVMFITNMSSIEYEILFKKHEKAAAQGYTQTQHNLGVCYYNGRGVEKDEQKAVEWYQKAAEQGYAQAQKNLGVCYRHGTGIEKDEQKAVEWYQKAADQGHVRARSCLHI